MTTIQSFIKGNENAYKSSNTALKMDAHSAALHGRPLARRYAEIIT